MRSLGAALPNRFHGARRGSPRAATQSSAAVSLSIADADLRFVRGLGTELLAFGAADADLAGVLRAADFATLAFNQSEPSFA